MAPTPDPTAWEGFRYEFYRFVFLLYSELCLLCVLIHEWLDRLFWAPPSTGIARMNATRIRGGNVINESAKKNIHNTLKQIDEPLSLEKRAMFVSELNRLTAKSIECMLVKDSRITHVIIGCDDSESDSETEEITGEMHLNQKEKRRIEAWIQALHPNDVTFLLVPLSLKNLLSVRKLLLPAPVNKPNTNQHHHSSDLDNNSEDEKNTEDNDNDNENDDDETGHSKYSAHSGYCPQRLDPFLVECCRRYGCELTDICYLLLDGNREYEIGHLQNVRRFAREMRKDLDELFVCHYAWKFQFCVLFYDLLKQYQNQQGSSSSKQAKMTMRRIPKLLLTSRLPRIFFSKNARRVIDGQSWFFQLFDYFYQNEYLNRQLLQSVIHVPKKKISDLMDYQRSDTYSSIFMHLSCELSTMLLNESLVYRLRIDALHRANEQKFEEWQKLFIMDETTENMCAEDQPNSTTNNLRFLLEKAKLSISANYQELLSVDCVNVSFPMAFYCHSDSLKGYSYLPSSLMRFLLNQYRHCYQKFCFSQDLSLVLNGLCSNSFFLKDECDTLISFHSNHSKMSMFQFYNRVWKITLRYISKKFKPLGNEK